MLRSISILHVFLGLTLLSLTPDPATVDAAEPPKAGEKAPDFQLSTIKGKEVRLSSLCEKGPVVVVLLRGYPGYQCPACTSQAGDYIGKAKSFGEAKTQVVLVYPGAAAKLEKHAEEFLGGKSMPEGFHFVLDSDYTFTSAYHLRWDAANETAYPATFVIDGEQKVISAKISKTHGGRTAAKDALADLKAISR